MTEFRFDPAEGLVLVEGHIRGPLGGADLVLAVDTGASVTLVTPETLDRIGYSARDGEAITTITTALGREHGYLLRVHELRALGLAVPGFRIHVHDLPDGSGINGLLGLDFLRELHVELRVREGVIRVEPATDGGNL